MLSWGVINNCQPLRGTLCTIGKLRNLTDGFLLTTERMDNCVNATDTIVALLSRLWTGFFDTARCRYTEKFSKPRFQPKMA